MSKIQGKPSGEAFAVSAVPARRLARKKIGRTGSHQVLAHCVAAGGSDVYLRNLHTHPCLAVWLVVAHRPHTPHYLQMILSVYATLGIFLLIASRKPLANLSLIWFTVWSSVVHAAVMAAQALANPEHIGHLWGDVLALFLVAAVLAFLTPRGAVAEPS